MPTGIKPKDVKTSNPTNPLKVRSNRVISPTLGGSGNAVNRPTSALDPFVNGKGIVKSSKKSTSLI
jgi:hypothetical protein